MLSSRVHENILPQTKWKFIAVYSLNCYNTHFNVQISDYLIWSKKQQFDIQISQFLVT